MKYYLVLFLVCLTTHLFSQNSEFFNGCDVQKSKRAKELCGFKTFNDLFNGEVFKVLDKYGERVPTGRAVLQFYILKDGSIDNFSYFDYDNENFAVFALSILVQISKDMDKYKLTFSPAIDSKTGDHTELKIQFPINLEAK